MTPTSEESSELQREATKHHYEETKESYSDHYLTLITLLEFLKEEGLSCPVGDLCDIGMFCRDMENLFDDLRKEVKARKELVEKLICVRQTIKVTEDPSRTLTVRGEYSLGVPDVRFSTPIPKRGSPDFMKMMSYFGATSEAANEVLSPSYERIGEHFSKLEEEGKPVPSFVSVKFPKYTVTFRKKK